MNTAVKKPTAGVLSSQALGPPSLTVLTLCLESIFADHIKEEWNNCDQVYHNTNLLKAFIHQSP